MPAPADRGERDQLLISVSGLPATGKTTMSRALGAELHGVHIRIDTIEQAMVESGMTQDALGPAGYCVGYALAADTLRQGFTVIAESVSPLTVTRDAWRDVASAAGVPCLEVELVCSDTAEHEHRVATRTVDIPGLALPDWTAVGSRACEPWNRPHLVVDTAGRSVATCVAEILAALPE